MKRLPWCIYCEMKAYPVYLAAHLVQVHNVPSESAWVIVECFTAAAKAGNTI